MWLTTTLWCLLTKYLEEPKQHKNENNTEQRVYDMVNKT